MLGWGERVGDGGGGGVTAPSVSRPDLASGAPRPNGGLF